MFAFHGYPSLIHELTYKRYNKNIHVRGYIEEGTITTPFDMRVMNHLDRFNLVMTAVYNLPQLGNRGSYLIQQMKDKLVEHKQYIAKYGVDLPEGRRVGNGPKQNKCLKAKRTPLQGVLFDSCRFAMALHTFRSLRLCGKGRRG